MKQWELLLKTVGENDKNIKSWINVNREDEIKKKFIEIKEKLSYKIIE